MLRPAYGLILFLAAAVGVLLIGGPDSQPLEDVQRTVAETSQNTADEKVLVPFVYVDGGASSVGVAGDFNSWEPTSLQRKNVDGRVVWTALVPVPRGEHRYMFVIDGHRWESDPLAPVHRDDGFGNSNAILAL